MKFHGMLLSFAGSPTNKLTPFAMVPLPSPTSLPVASSSSSATPNDTTTDDGNNNISSNIIILQSQCHCRRVVLDISLLPAEDPRAAKVANCHCESCRKYHTSAYVSYLRVPKGQISVRKGRDLIGKFPSSCQGPGENKNNGENEHYGVERWYCTRCSSKLVSSVVAENEKYDNDNDCRVNLGPLVEATVPASNSNRWKEQLKLMENNLQSSSAGIGTCSWNEALPKYAAPALSDDAAPATYYWTGSCACGSCRYEVAVARAYQLQHCYCHLCRELSGGPYTTWVPVCKSDFSWKERQQRTDDASDDDGQQIMMGVPNLVRTTESGSRHICSNCRGILTIVYDDQPNLIWPCAGGFDDASLPPSSEEMGTLLKRVCHICCTNLPPWLDLPEDGMERLADAC